MIPVVFHKLFLRFAGFGEVETLLLFPNNIFFKSGNKFETVSGVYVCINAVNCTCACMYRRRQQLQQLTQEIIVE